MSWPNYREAFTVVMLRVRQPFCSAKASCRWARGGSRGRQAIKNRRARHLYTLQSTRGSPAILDHAPLHWSLNTFELLGTPLAVSRSKKRIEPKTKKKNYLSIYLFIHPSIHLSIYLYIFIYVHI